MRHGKLSRFHVVALFGEEVVAKLDAEPCEPTSRLQTFQFPCGNYGRCKTDYNMPTQRSMDSFNSHAGIMVVVRPEVFTNSEHGCECFNSHAGIMVVVRGIAGNEYIL